MNKTKWLVRVMITEVIALQLFLGGVLLHKIIQLNGSKATRSSLKVEGVLAGDHILQVQQPQKIIDIPVPPSLKPMHPGVIQLENEKLQKDEVFLATAYDLSYESCGKRPGTPQYGMTFMGTVAKRGRTVAVDPSVIALGTQLQITFPDKWKYLSGIYIAEDTGSLVKGRVIDVFLGKEASKEMKQLGSRVVYVRRIVSAN